MQTWYSIDEIVLNLKIHRTTFYNYIKYGFIGEGIKRKGSNKVWYTFEEFEDLKNKLKQLGKLKED